MTIDDKISDQQLQYDINREAAKISALSSGKIDKNEYLAGGKILPFNQRKIVEQTKFSYSPLRKAIEKEKQIKEKNRQRQLKTESKKFLDTN